MNHTPGPWRETDKGVRSDAGYICFWVSKPMHYIGQDKRYSDELEERAANCRLVTAAPNLLEACKQMLDIINESTGIAGWHLNGDLLLWGQCEQVQMLIDAVKKAEKGE
jgi:hypothetical protein